MKSARPPRRLASAWALAVAVSVALGSWMARGQSPAPTSSATVSATAPRPSSEAPAAAPTRFEQLDFPPGESTRPRPVDWKDAAVFFRQESFPRCTARRVREWVEVACFPAPGSAITLFSGPARDYAAAPGGGESATDRTPARVVFPLRRGSRFLIGISHAFLQSYQDSESAVTTPMLLSAYWLADDPRPVVVFSRP